MNITFDTASVSANEARGLIALLSSLLPSTGQQVPQISSPPETVNVAPIIHNQPEPPLPALVNGAASPEAQPTPMVNGAAEPPTEPAKRGRKPKVTSIDAGAQATPAPAPEPASEPVQAEAKPNGKAISADELRSALNGFIQRHSMEDAIAKLKAFGCNRVTEALNLEPARLSELAQALNA